MPRGKANQNDDQTEGATAEIHHYFQDPVSKGWHLDEFGEKLDGFYFRIVGAGGKHLSDLEGPYQQHEIEGAARDAFRSLAA